MSRSTDLARSILGSRPVRAVARGAAGLGLATTMLAITTGSTLAYDNNGSNATLAGYGVTVSAAVTCDPASSTMTVSASATTMQASGLYGPIAGPFDGGQWLSYSVWARELGAANWNQVYTWSNWQFIRSNLGGGDLTIISPQALGTSVVNGTAGHNYDIIVQIDYWTGVENVINVTPSYSQNLTMWGMNYYMEPGYCHL